MNFYQNCQAIYDENGYFKDVELKWLGSVHDDFVYSNSFIKKQLRSGDEPQVYQELMLGGTPVPHFLKDDLFYLFLANILKEYSTVRDTEHSVSNGAIRSTRS